MTTVKATHKDVAGLVLASRILSEYAKLYADKGMDDRSELSAEMAKVMAELARAAS